MNNDTGEMIFMIVYLESVIYEGQDEDIGNDIWFVTMIGNNGNDI